MEDKKFIRDKILPKILKGEFIRGNNSIIIEFPFVLMMVDTMLKYQKKNLLEYIGMRLRRKLTKQL